MTCNDSHVDDTEETLGNGAFNFTLKFEMCVICILRMASFSLYFGYQNTTNPYCYFTVSIYFFYILHFQ